MSNRKKFYWPALGLLTTLFTLTMFSTVSSVVLASTGSPSISSDQPDYAAGSVATLSGSGWQGDNSVAITVDDNIGRSWSWSGTATPDTNGDFTITVTLSPNFIAEYLVTATGSPSGAVATATFTDSVGLNILGTDGSQHQNPSDTENLGNVSGTQNFGISVKGSGLGGGSTSFSLSFVGAANGASVSPSSGSVSGSTATPVTLTINTSTLTVGTTYTDHLQATGGPSVTSGDYYFKFTVVASNHAPVAANNSYSTDEDTNLSVAAPGVLGNDTDADGDSLTANLVVGPSHGSLTLNADGSFSYDPSANYHGPDSFTYRANDGTVNSNTATVSITVNSVNDAPVVTLSGPATANEGGTESYSFTTSDIDSSSFTLDSRSCGMNGTVSNVTFSSSTGAGSFDCTWSDNGSSTVSVTVKDDDGGSDIDSITVAVANVAPTVTLSGQSTADEGDTNSYSFTTSDPGSADTFVLDSVSCGANGTESNQSFNALTGAGSFDCTWSDNGSSTVSVTVKDDDGGSDIDSITVAVANVAPTINGFSITGGSTVACIGGNSVTVSFTVSDPADNTHDPITGTINWGDSSSTTISGRTISQSHTYSAGTYTITVSVNDGDGGTDSDGGPGAGSASLLYNASGVLQPVNDTQAHQDPSIFKYGSTIPVKIKVTDCNGVSVSGLSPQISVKKTSGSTPPTGVDEAITSTSGADTGTTMRYDSAGQQYIYNLATKSLSDSSATYTITITGPFPPVTANFGTRPK